MLLLCICCFWLLAATSSCYAGGRGERTIGCAAFLGDSCNSSFSWAPFGGWCVLGERAFVRLLAPSSVSLGTERTAALLGTEAGIKGGSWALISAAERQGKLELKWWDFVKKQK